MPELRLKALTGTIIGVYYDVYNNTARTYPEYIYENAMMDDLKRKGVQCRRQPEYRVFYKDRLVGIQQLDLFVAEEVVVELKVASQLTKLHKAQAISYLKVVGKEDGLICNFGSPTPDFSRLYFRERSNPVSPTTSDVLQGDLPADLLAPELTYGVIGGLYDVHSTLGPGFIHRIYANAVYHELLLRGLEPYVRKEYQVIYRGRPIGDIKFNHLQIDDQLMVFPAAITDIADLSVGNLKAWMAVQEVPLGIVATFHSTRLAFKVLRV